MRLARPRDASSGSALAAAPVVPLAGSDVDRAALAAQRERFGSPERGFVYVEPAIDLDRLEVVMVITDYQGEIRAATDPPTDQVNPGRQVDRSATGGSIGDGHPAARERQYLPPSRRSSLWQLMCGAPRDAPQGARPRGEYVYVLNGADVLDARLRYLNKAVAIPGEV